MSRRLDVIAAVKALIVVALPQATVLGLEGDEAPAVEATPGGVVTVRTGDPGEPEIDLSPLSYNYFHRIPLDVVTGPLDDRSAEQVLDDMLAMIGAAIEADRTLGGLCRWLEAEAPTTADIYADGGGVLRGADLDLVAEYATPNSLT